MVYLRIADSHRVSGVQTGQWEDIDQPMIRSEYDSISGTVLAAPSGLAVTGTLAHSVSLAWTDHAGKESNFELKRSQNGVDFELVAAIPANATGFTDTGRAPETTYDYRLQAINGAGASGYSDVVQALTGVAPNITLAASGSKMKGVQHADLTWFGALSASLCVMRDDILLTTIQDSDSYHDNIGNKGNGSYSYQVCETADPSIYSLPIQVNF